MERIRIALPELPILVATSTDPSDDPLVAHLSGTPVFRGPLNDVWARFRLCALESPSDWVLRISADSPLIDPRIVRAVASGSDRAVDIVTTTAPRSFPRGQNAELIRTSLFDVAFSPEMTDDDREHVTPYYYRHPDRFRILNLHSGHPELADVGLAVDTAEDLQRLETLTDDELSAFPYDRIGFA